MASSAHLGQIVKRVGAIRHFQNFQEAIGSSDQPESLYYAIPDLHGRVDLFEKCVVSLESVPGRVIFLGDYIDRLPSFRLVNQLIELESKRPDYILLPGNHEWMCLEWYLENQLKIKTGRLKDLKTPEATLMAEWKEKGEVPLEQIRFFERILRKRYHLSEKGHLLFVHAGVERSLKSKSLESMDPDQFLWSRRMPVDYRGPTLIHGHTFAGSEPLVSLRQVNLETRCWLNPGRPLTVGVFRDVPELEDPFLGIVKIEP